MIMDTPERERADFVFALIEAIRKHNLDRLIEQEARVETPITMVMNDLRLYPSIPRTARESIFSDTFSLVKSGRIANKHVDRGSVAV